jgi:hypothetical protein
MREYSWPKPVRREDGRVCESAEVYFYGLFFNENSIAIVPISIGLFSDLLNILGRFLYEALIPDRKLCDTPSFLRGEEKELFLDLAKEMLIWHLDARKKAGELARHPFLQPK